MMSPTISVVIPAYNAEDFIANALDSVLAQTCPPKEVIIVDDGSVDDTYKTIQKYIASNDLDNWILVRQPNGGPAKARDRAIRLATASHVALLDADDAWLPTKLEISLAYLESQRLDVIGAHVKASQHENNCRLLSPKTALFFNPYCTSTIIFSRDAYLEVGGFDLNQRYSEDYKLWLTFLWRKKRCGQMSQSKTIYRANLSTQHKGLTSQLWLMQSNEIDNYASLRLHGILPSSWCLIAQFFSWIKFSRRFILNI